MSSKTLTIRGVWAFFVVLACIAGCGGGDEPGKQAGGGDDPPAAKSDSVKPDSAKGAADGGNVGKAGDGETPNASGNAGADAPKDANGTAAADEPRLPVDPPSFADVIGVVDMRTAFELLPEAAEVRRTLTDIYYDAPGTIESSMEFHAKQLREDGWEELEEHAHATPATVMKYFDKDGYLLFLYTSTGSTDGRVNVSLDHFGNVDCRALPHPAGADVQYAVPQGCSFIVTRDMLAGVVVSEAVVADDKGASGDKATGDKATGDKATGDAATGEDGEKDSDNDKQGEEKDDNADAGKPPSMADLGAAYLRTALGEQGWTPFSESYDQFVDRESSYDVVRYLQGATRLNIYVRRRSPDEISIDYHKSLMKTGLTTVGSASNVVLSDESGIMTYDTDVAPDKVAAHYRDELATLGWKVMPGGEDTSDLGAQLVLEHGEDRSMNIMALKRKDGGASVNVSAIRRSEALELIEKLGEGGE